MNHRESASPPATETRHEGAHATVDCLLDLIGRFAIDHARLQSALDDLERDIGRAIYSELVHLVSHLWFEPDEAKEHWDRIVRLRAEMEAALDDEVDIRVALVRYFVNVTRRIASPKIIELEVFRQTQASIYRDELTGLHNFRYMQEQLAREIERCRRQGGVLSLVMIDVDDFKHYNDRNGHLAGNDVLGGTGRILTESIRACDVAVRYGGEEFALILPSTPKHAALEIAERVRRRIAAEHFEHGYAQPGGRITASFGVATFPGDAADGENLVREADRAMYVAKSQGKDLVCGSGDSHRSHRRVEAEIEGCYRALSPDFQPCRTADLSEGGLLLLGDEHLAVGTLIEVRLRIDEGDDETAAFSGRVARVEKRDAGLYGAAVQIVEMSTADRRRLAQFLAAAA